MRLVLEISCLNRCLPFCLPEALERVFEGMLDVFAPERGVGAVVSRRGIVNRAFSLVGAMPGMRHVQLVVVEEVVHCGTARLRASAAQRSFRLCPPNA